MIVSNTIGPCACRQCLSMAGNGNSQVQHAVQVREPEPMERSLTKNSKKANVGIYDRGTHEFTLFVGLALQYGGAHLGPSGSRLMRLMER